MSHSSSPLSRTVTGRPTDFWNDSCAPDELKYAISHGAVGATSNPTIVLAGIKKDPEPWRARIREVAQENADYNEVQVAWQIVEEFALKGADLLMGVFRETGGKKGRLSLQTNPQNYRSKDALIEQASRFGSLGPNTQVKLPATHAGVLAIEEVTAAGVSINATVSFTVPQALAVAEAVKRGLERRVSEGKSIDDMSPVCTIMVGRMDDWLKVIAEKEDRVPTPGHLDWAGVACFKNAYRLFQERGYKTRLLAAAYRNHLHWSEFIGGDVILTIPSGWQKRFNASNVEVKDRMADPVPGDVMTTLNSFEDFRRAYEPDGLTTREFDSYGATRRTLKGFLSSYDELIQFVREEMVPNPD